MNTQIVFWKASTALALAVALALGGCSGGAALWQRQVLQHRAGSRQADVRRSAGQLGSAAALLVKLRLSALTLVSVGKGKQVVQRVDQPHQVDRLAEQVQHVQPQHVAHIIHFGVARHHNHGQMRT